VQRRLPSGAGPRAEVDHLVAKVSEIAIGCRATTPFPDTIRNDMAFHDRWHAYLPGWKEALHCQASGSNLTTESCTTSESMRAWLSRSDLPSRSYAMFRRVQRHRSEQFCSDSLGQCAQS
jgi:hypothetical protein